LTLPVHFYDSQNTPFFVDLLWLTVINAVDFLVKK